MFGGGHIQTGAGRYFQSHGALKKLGEEVADYGKKIFVLYADETVKSKTKERVETSLREKGLDYHTMIYTGPSSRKGFELVAGELKSYGADVIVGVGGGRILDVAKASGDLAGIHVFTAPTSAGTCAAYAILYVEYAENGRIARNGFMKHEICGVLADLDYILDDCPVRYFVSGIADSMAKHPEFTFTSLLLGEEGRIPPTVSGVMIAGYTYEQYLTKGIQAVEEFKNKSDSSMLEDFVNMNIMMTGLISNLSVGGKSLALAHIFYDAICYKYHEIRANFLHGELVGMALPVQLYINGCPEEEIYRLQEFLRALNVPVKLEEIGFPEDPAALEDLAEYLYVETCNGFEELRGKIREGLNYLK